MGSLAKTHASGHIHHHGRVNRNPLRKIVGHETNEYGALREVLECGHRVVPREDFIGPTNATRRRCYQCGRAVELP
jgi:hypothetical protein